MKNEVKKIFPIICLLITLTAWSQADNEVFYHVDSSNFLDVKHLDLSHRNLKYIPELVFECENLEVLDLSNNQLSSLSDSLTQLINLTKVVLDHNPFEFVNGRIFRKLVNLKDVSLNQCIPFQDANQLISVLSHLPLLESLSIKDNHWEELPSSIKSFKSLKELKLCGNMIVTLPSGFEKLNTLSHLYMRRMDVMNFEEVFITLSEMSSLYHIDLSYNNLDRIPQNLFLVRYLKELNLSNNQLTFLDDKIKELIRLERLDASHNAISVLGRSFGLLGNLAHLDLSYNELDYIPSTINQLIELEHLSLAANKIDTFKWSSLRLPMLKELYLNDNNLRKMRLDISYWSTLQKVNLNNCDLYYFRISKPERLRQLTELSMSNNPAIPWHRVVQQVIEIKSLKKLDISYNEIEDLPGHFTNLVFLRHLNISGNVAAGNNLAELLSKMALHTLELSSMDLSSVPDFLGKMSNLKHLALDDNGIEVLSDNLVKCSKLQSLSLNGNPVKKWSANMVDLKYLHSVSLKEVAVDLSELTKNFEDSDVNIVDISQSTIINLPTIPQSVSPIGFRIKDVNYEQDELIEKLYILFPNSKFYLN